MDKFPKNCPLPYNSPPRKHQVDITLCASGSPKPITLDVFAKLQKAVDDRNVVYGDRTHLPFDRTKLQNITTSSGTFGEGDVVTFEGWIEKAKRGSQESCNCVATTVNETDIHIHLVETPGTSLCDGIVAEMTPHYRPTAWHWTTFRDLADGGWPVRVTGQLFFDGSHRPCKHSKAGASDPARLTVWEIHPIYRFEVCVDEHCDQPSSWVTVAKWDRDFNQ